jgi:L-seryl-tRNA(Ser) seleniumtransferase
MSADPSLQDRLRAVPSVQRLLEEPALRQAESRLGRAAVLDAVRQVLEDVRRAVASGRPTAPPASELAERAAARARTRLAGGVRRAINATGVILHTGLGRAVLPEAALRDIAAELGGYCKVEVDFETGQRGERDLHAAKLLTTILGCQAATVVNNNAAATLLVLSALARGKEVIVSRGQLIEIGGSFRIPDVMKASGARLVEVGCTNRTHLRDYEDAITPETALLLEVHTSNYRIVGFTHQVGIGELARLGKARGLPVVHDVGSGALLPGMAPELRDEPIVKESLDAGADLVTFSGDKILGGPQFGAVVGREDLVRAVRKHPLWRAMRLDKLILRALESTLALYLDPERLGQSVPTLRMLHRPLKELEAQAEELAAKIRKACPALEARTAPDSSRLGSGSLPEYDIPTRVVRLRHKDLTPDQLAARLRAWQPMIVGRIQDDWLLLDPRTLQSGEDEEIARAFGGMKVQGPEKERSGT